MMNHVRRIGLGLLTTLAVGSFAAQLRAGDAEAGPASERFEVAHIKAVRPTLVDTITALQKHDATAAKTAFEAYDSGWNGIEVYINTRNKDLYDELEHNYQTKIAQALNGPNPDTTALLSDAQAMLAKYDEAISMVAKAVPLNPLYDDIARVRMVRAHLREVNPALKAGDIAKARKSFSAFDNQWDSIEDLIKARSSDSYVAVEKGMIQIEQALMPAKPDVAQVSTLVSGVLDQYNAVVTAMIKDARAHP